jgi:Na+/melibiose symporter-like transporter
MSNWATLGVRPPAKPVDRLSSGRFVRAMLVRTLGIVCPIWILLLLTTGGPTWMFVVATCSVAVLMVDIAWLTYRIRRDERSAKP